MKTSTENKKQFRIIEECLEIVLLNIIESLITV